MRPSDFEDWAGHEAKIELKEAIEGRRRFRGELVSFEAGRACIRVDGKPFEIPFAEVSKASQVYHYTSADFAKSKVKEVR